MVRRSDSGDEVSTVAKSPAPYVKIQNRPDGCSLHDHCLTCPLPACRYEISPVLVQKVLARLRAEEGAARSASREPVAVRGGRG